MIYILDYKTLADSLAIDYIIEKVLKEGDTVIIPENTYDLILVKVNENDREAIEAKRNFEYLVEKSKEKKYFVKIIKSGLNNIVNEIIYLAKVFNAVVITEDYYLLEKLKVEKVSYKLIKKLLPNVEDFFKDKDIFTVIIRENEYIVGKKGKPGNFELVRISKNKIKPHVIRALRDYFLDMVKKSEEWILDKEEDKLYVIRYKNYRITIIEPPYSDKLEITIVKTLKNLKLDDYKLPKEVIERIDKKAEGIIICGPPGSGKSTFARALLNYYKSKGKVVKMIENPASERVLEEITYITKNMFKNIEEIKDYLLLSRPDYVLFDEVRDEEDFNLFIDLRLSGIGLIGVTHGTSPIEALNRFINRVDVGVLPNVIDTIFFISEGEVKEVLELKLVVKVPTGMKKEDYARPVVEVRDFITKELLYEIYKFGQEVIIKKIEKGDIKVKVEEDKKVLEKGEDINLEIEESKVDKLRLYEYIYKAISNKVELDDFLEEIKKKYVIDSREFEKIMEFISEFTEKILDYGVDIFIGGNLGKRSLVKGNDISVPIFILFYLGESNIYQKAELIVKDVFKGYNIVKIKNIDESIEFKVLISNEELGYNFLFKLYPAYNITLEDYRKEPNKFKSLEKNYLKQKYVIDFLEKFDFKNSDDLAIFKLFAKSIKVDGTDAYVEGFSTFSLELMWMYFESFKKLLGFFNFNEKYPIYIDVGKIYNSLVKFLESYSKGKKSVKIPKVIVINPITKKLETVTLSDATFSKFVFFCKLLYNYPSHVYFENLELTIEDIIKLAEVRGAEIIHDRKIIVDKISPVVRSLKERLKILKEKIEKQGREVYEYGVYLRKDPLERKKPEAYPWIMIDAKRVKKGFINIDVWKKDFIKEFVEYLNRNYNKIVAGPFIDYETTKVYFDVIKESTEDKLGKIFKEIVMTPISLNSLKNKLKSQ